MTTAELLHGFEQDTAFVTAEGVTRGQAKALAAYELCEPFTDLRCRRVWMQYRPITEQEACDLITDDWWPGYECYVCCKPDAPDARPFWWIEWGYALRLRERQRAANSQASPADRGGGVIRWLAATAATLTLATHHSWPRPWPAWWHAQAMCIHQHEAPDWHERSNPYSRGGMQITWATWRSVGGRGDPASASVGEQLYRAWLIWRRDGGSWREWTTARLCGLR